jgi:hypothetical protein
MVLQEDLIPEDVMLLDCWECLYLWVGKGSNKTEREQAQTLAIVSMHFHCCFAYFYHGLI